MLPKGFFLAYAKHLIFGSLCLVIVSVFVFILNLRPSIQFTGGISIEFSSSVVVSDLVGPVRDALVSTFSGQTVPDLLFSQDPVPTLTIPFSDTFFPQGDSDVREIVADIVGDETRILSYRQIGPSFGSYARSRSLLWLGMGIAIMVVYIFFAFAELRKKLDPLYLAMIVVVTMVFDIMVSLGVYGLFMNMSSIYVFDTLVILAILSIMGYSINDTIIILDRMRENIDTDAKSLSIKDWSNLIDTSIGQTLRRSLFTSLSTLIITLTLAFLGQGDMQRIALIISTGVVVGTFSSLFLVPPTLLLLVKYHDPRRHK
ncbi:MAG: protein translocase subunit SecF [Candidatus Absconditabacterales bacterium]|nr:protein translocase subunit SecF [Candidatus Absconditabacterales bacterium]